MLAILIIISLLCALVLLVAIIPESFRHFRYIALFGSLAGLCLLPLVQYGTYTLPWFSSGLFNISFSISAINLLLLFIVLVIAPVVIMYSFGFIDTPSQQKRFYIELLAFEAAMAVFAVSANFITLFIAWSFLSLTSYLLIGFWDERHQAARAARKALTSVFIGDIALLGAIVILASSFYTLTFTALPHAALSNPPAALAAAVLLVVAALAKSAQFPFQEWLPDAMEGPAPVSAFLHSATMVKAGVFLVVLMLPFFDATGVSVAIAMISIVTIILATANALRSTHIKRIIAYSTIQELGLMLFAISSGAVLAGLYLFFTQTFYKALLFLSSGSAMKATGKDDIREVTGLRQNKLLFVSTLFGVLSVVGFLPFEGFFSNYVLGASLSMNFGIYAGLNLLGMLTSLYIFRWFLAIARKPSSGAVAVEYDALPRSMVAAAALLGVATLVASVGFIYFPTFILSTSSQYSVMYQVFSLSYPDTLLIMLPPVVGALLVYVAYRRGYRVRSRVLDAVLGNSGFFNLLYSYFARLVLAVASGFAAADESLDSSFEHFGRLVFDSYALSRGFSSGSINRYALWLGLAVAVVLAAIYLIR